MSDHIPHGDTALRLSWRFLPPSVRSAVAQQLGQEVVGARSCDAGFTPGFASVLTCADGSQHFVKAAAVKAQRLFVDHYRREAEVLRRLPAGVPAARLRWSMEVDDWFVFSTEFVPGRTPRRPWRLAELNAALDACEQVVSAGTPAPATFPRLVDELAGAPALWDLLPAGSVAADQLAEARALTVRYAEALDGEALVHQDLRDDNVVLPPEGGAVLVDWNWPARGAAWFDSLCLLLGPRGDGMEVDSVLRERPLFHRVPDESIDIALALLAGSFLGQASQQVPSNSPHLRDAQWRLGETAWNWLAERRDWPQ